MILNLKLDHGKNLPIVKGEFEVARGHKFKKQKNSYLGPVAKNRTFTKRPQNRTFRQDWTISTKLRLNVYGQPCTTTELDVSKTSDFLQQAVLLYTESDVSFPKRPIFCNRLVHF